MVSDPGKGMLGSWKQESLFLWEHIEGVFSNDVTHEVNEAPAASVLLKV